MRLNARLLVAGFGLVAALGGASAHAQSLPPVVSGPDPVALDVPYLPQSELLCGGAALAMVERWWGKRGVYAEDFAALVRRELGGIRTADLAAAARGRGWETAAFSGNPEQIQRVLAEGVPVIALIQVGPRRYHYVVLLEWSKGRVVFHDPAVAPSAVMEEEKFLTAWDGTDRWAMVIRPAEPAPAVATTVDPPAAPKAGVLPCPPWLDQGIDAAMGGRLEEAARKLEEARVRCPGEPVILRELAGVQFKQKLYSQAAAMAREYLSLAPADSLGWQLLAASRYLSGDGSGALAAWNQLGRPRVDLIRVEGSRKIRYRVLADAASIPHGAILTPPRLARAERRVADLPALTRARVDYTPIAGGEVELRVAVAERPVVEKPLPLLLAGVARGFAQSEARLEVASPTGLGELWTATWRWQPGRPRVGMRLDIPVRIGIPEVLGVDGGWNRYRFAVDTAAAGHIDQERRRARLDLGGWVTGNIHPSVAVGLERWSSGPDYLTAALGTQLRAYQDRLAFAVTGELGQALTSAPSYTRASASLSWASAIGLRTPAWSTRIGADFVSSNTPLGVWPGAGADLSWAIPLRAHFAGSHARLPAAGSGRSIAYGGVAGDVPVYRLGPIVFAVGTFLDGATIFNPADGSSRSRFYLDAGAGVRIGIADGRLGVLRVDWAHGLRDKASALTLGMHQRWPVLQ